MPSAYEIPPYGGKSDVLSAWMNSAVEEGNIWLGAQKPTKEWSKILEVLGPMYGGGPAAAGQSGTGFNLVRYDYSQIRATLSNFKHAGEIVPTEDDAQEHFDRAHLLTNLDRNWERTTFSNLVIRDVLGYALGKGTGYFYEDWDKSRWGPGRGDIRLRAVDPVDVTFIQLPKTHEIQQAYVVLIRETLPLQLAKRMYASNPTFANALVPDGDGRGMIQKGLERVQQFISPMLNTSGSIRKNNETFPTVNIWHAYTMDGSVNPHAEPLKMGAMGTNWSYTVPALGDPIPQGIINPATGSPWTLPATPEDCLMFPLRRLTIFSKTAVAYDGSSPWWHGAVPLARLRFNDLPWESLGASQIGDAVTMQDGIVAVMRAVEDSVAARLDPPAVWSDQVDKAVISAFNPRKAGSILQADLSQGVPVEYPFPPGNYDVPAWVIGEGGYVRQQEDRIEKITSVRDLVAVAKAGQIPSSDTLEKLMEMAGPIVQDMVGALIQPLTEIGEWRKALYFQFYTRQRMLRIADPNAAEMLSNVKYVPEKLVPYTAGDTAQQMAAKARAFLDEYRYEVSQSGLTELNRMSTVLLYFQATKLGFPISWWTLAKAMRLPNFGPPPKDCDTEMERWVAQQKIQADLQVELAQQLQEAQGGGVAPGGGGPEGRPPSMIGPPKLVNKPNENRSTITTS